MIDGMQEGDLHVHVVDHRFRVLHRAANGHRWPVVVTVGPARQISQNPGEVKSREGDNNMQLKLKGAS